MSAKRCREQERFLLLSLLNKGIFTNHALLDQVCPDLVPSPLDECQLKDVWISQLLAEIEDRQARVAARDRAPAGLPQLGSGKNRTRCRWPAS